MAEIDLAKLKEIGAKYFEKAQTVNDQAGLESLRLAFFGKNGDIKQLQKSLSTLAAELRPQFGQAINELRSKFVWKQRRIANSRQVNGLILLYRRTPNI